MEQTNEPNTTIFGIHLLLDGYRGAESKLADRTNLHMTLEQLVVQLQMNKITDPVVVKVGPNNKKDPGGLSGFVLIAESHISIHTFPKRGFVSIDIYTCQDTLETETVETTVRSCFDIQIVESTVLQRGRKYPTKNIY